MPAYNELKLRTLEIFARSGPIRPGEYMVRARFYPLAAAQGYCVRLMRMGLLHRGSDARGLHLYSLSPAGEKRLRWLRDQRPKPAPAAS